MMNTSLLDNLRHEAELHHIDTSRATITRTGAGDFSVVFDKPRIDCGPLLTTPVTNALVHTAFQAEVEMLRGLIRLERAERQTCRMGICGWSSADICHRPLSVDEVAAYNARMRHARRVHELRDQLADALQRRAKIAKADEGVAELQARYGVKEEPAKADEGVAELQACSGVKEEPAKRGAGRPRKYPQENSHV